MISLIKIRNFIKEKFSIYELSGAFGDWGTLVPFIIGYISIVKINPAGIFLCLGLINIYLGIRYDLPLPVQPQKSIGTVAISQKWTPEKVISTGFGTGIIWIILAKIKILNKISNKIPKVVIRGIQLGLALILGWSASLLLHEDIVYGLISIFIILLFIKKEKAPIAIILLFLGLIIIFFTNDFSFGKIIIEDSAQFRFYVPNLGDFLIGMLAAGIAQIFLTLTNVMVATISLIQDLFPEKSDRIDANGLASNMGAINAISPFFGGIPLCHGSGGLASQYAFGARTGGSMIFEGILEIVLGIFFSGFLFNIFILFPKGILGAMLIYTAFLLGRMAFKEFQYNNLPIIITIALICFFINITLGFLIGLISYFIYKKFFIRNRSS